MSEPAPRTRVDLDESVATALEAVADAMAEAQPDYPALVHGTTRRTWPELDRRAAGLAAFLDERGVQRGTRVGIALHNSPAYVEALLATMKLGATPVNINYRYRDEELRHVLTHADVHALFHDESLAETVGRVRRDLRRLATLVHSGPLSRAAEDSVELDDAVRSCPPVPRRPRDGSDRLLLMTGGTTGSPKGVEWENRALLANASGVYGRVGLPVPASLSELADLAVRSTLTGQAPVLLPAPPLMHGTGFFFTLGNLMTGGTVVFPVGRSLDPHATWSLVAGHGVTDLVIVGDAFGRPMLDALEQANADGRPYDLTSLRRVASSGVTWSPAVKAGLLRFADLQLIDTIAASEGGPFAMQVTTRDDPPTSSFVLSQTARVVTREGRDVEPGSCEAGFLAASGPLPVGYLDDPERTARVFCTMDGLRYAIPGDLARVENDGTLTLLGRSSGVINTGGEKVYAEEVAEVLAAHSDVRDVVVVGVPDERWGSRIVAVVAPEPGSSPRPDALTAFVGERLADYKRPRSVVYVEAIRRSPAGKADLRWACSVAADGEGGR